MFFYEYFYRKYGIRRSEQLITPPLPLLDLLELPKQSILHYVTTSPIDTGPAADDFMFRNITKPIMMGHVLENGDSKGIPRRLAVSPESMIRTYHIKNRRFKMMRDLATASRDTNTLVVYNYGLIPHLYHYARSLYTEYYKWWNIQAAVWKNVGTTASTSDRQQFVVCKLPQVLPSVSDLRLASTGPVSQKTIKIFNSPDSLMLLELWKWLGVNRSNSVLGNIPLNQLNRINLIFQESGRWFVVNLGLINKWRVATEEELAEFPDDVNTKGIEPGQIQRRFLRLLMALFEVRTAPESKTEEAAALAEKIADKDDPVKVAATTSVVVTQPTTIPVINKETGTVVLKQQTKPLPKEAEEPTTHMELPAHTGNDITHDDEFEKQLLADLAELETISKNHIGQHEDEPVVIDVPVIQEAVTLEDGIMRVCDKLADAGLISAAEYRRYGTIAGTYRHLVSPDGKTTLDKFIQIDPAILKIQESPAIKAMSAVVDKSMLQSSLLVFDQRYVKEVLHRDVASMVMNIQHAGIAVTNYEMERVEDVLGSYDAFTVRTTPVDGTSSTFRFKLPVIEDDGTYQANGIKYRMRKQRGELPIRKMAPDRVALTSYYGKVFASRSSKRVNNYGEWLCNAVMARGLSVEDSSVTNLHPAVVFDNLFKSPRLYSALAMGFRGFTLTPQTYPRTIGNVPFEMSFDHTKREKLYGREALALYEKDGSVVCGQNHKGQFLVVGKDDALYVSNGDSLIDYGSIEMLLGLESEKAPVEFAELKIMGRTIPIGLILGYEMGLEKLMKLLNVTPRRIPAGTRLGLGAHEYALVFSDESLVFEKDDRAAAIVLAGFSDFHRAIRNYSVYEFDRPGVYLNVLETGGASVRYLREIDLMYQLFIDPITRDLLVEMGEPTNFRGLLIRSCEMLLLDQHPSELDSEFMRIKGYERMAGAVYSEITRSIRSHNGRAGKSKHPIDLNPYAVWQNISKDTSIEMVSDINPIQNLKEMEAVTYSGTGGRNSRSMTKHTRAYHPNDMGTISESTVDSSDVSINTYLSADPQFTSLRGMSRRYELNKTGATALLSTSALLSPSADRDDPKRVNFIAIQQRHGVSCSGYGQLPVRTGYEQVLAHRTSDLFALTAKKAGKVTSISPSGIIVQYADGETKGYELGRRFGNAAGLTIPHNVVSSMKEGQAFKEGDLICHNDGFFEKDILNPNNVVWKGGIMVKTVLLESTVTLEDSSAISKRAAGLLTTMTTKVKKIVVNFDQSLHRLVKVGDKVESENILCTIEDAVTANSGLFDADSLDTLRVLSAQTPQAKVKGVVERVEVFYHGDKEDMSDSMRAIVTASDRDMAKRYTSSGKKAFTGSVDESFRVDGDPLSLDTAVIQIYITGEVPAGVGDKGVFCNQMKTVFGEILEGEIISESGKVVDAVFGQKSIADRIVLSPEIIGTTATLLDVIGRLAVKKYKE
jgi:hypothetical protein